ncbi:latrophilin Cirl [Trichonephila clavipes]|uniref:Latrophilin Cirl n=1 Tax=Trichonephila clavipes TaxID=2585209 RepID=A0A8X6SI00_TRICX|nr:latrophilin Cirl [Trichonephila clavipes]
MFFICVNLHFLKKQTEEGGVDRRHGGGRVRSTTPAEDRYIVLSAKRNRRTTAQQVANQFLAAPGKQISRKTVARHLRGGGLYARRPVVCVPLTRQHRTARLQWCREHHNWTEQDWACVLFSDESRFNLSSGCRRQLIWRESGTAYRPENIQEKDRYPTCSIMVWAGIMINGRTRLHVVANGTMTGQRYIDEVLLPHVRLFRGAVGDKFVFMDDNATCHGTLAVQDCLDSEGIQRLVWPVRSPDLNPIENVWDALGRQVSGRNYPQTNKNTLIRALTEEWDKLPQQLLDNVVQNAAGYRTTYACEGKTLNIICDEGMIHLIRANYGRFSISICNDHGNLDWRVNCMSHHSFLIMQDRCNLKPNCSVNVSSTTFHDPCPGTLKYLEVQYHCGTGAPIITLPVTSPSPPPKATYTSNVTVIPIGKIQTVTHRPIVSTTVQPLPTIIPLVKTSSASPKYLIPTTAVSLNKSETFYEYSTVGKAIDVAPTMGNVPSSAVTSTVSTTTVFFNEGYCKPTLARGIKWAWTKAGDVAFAKCPDGATGTAQWQCKANPTRWNPESPNLNQCHSLWLENLKERLQTGDSISSTAQELAVMSSAKPLFSEDLKIISELIQQALYKSVNSMENFLDTWHRYHVLRELLQVYQLKLLLSNLK